MARLGMAIEHGRRLKTPRGAAERAHELLDRLKTVQWLERVGDPGHEHEEAAAGYAAVQEALPRHWSDLRFDHEHLVEIVEQLWRSEPACPPPPERYAELDPDGLRSLIGFCGVIERRTALHTHTADAKPKRTNRLLPLDLRIADYIWEHPGQSEAAIHHKLGLRGHSRTVSDSVRRCLRHYGVLNRRGYRFKDDVDWPRLRATLHPDCR